MENINKDEYIYLLAVNTLGLDKTILTYDVTPFKTLDAANDAELDMITNTVKANKGAIDYVAYKPHDCIDKDEHDSISCSKIEFKSGVEVTYKVLLRKINEAK
jgi:hypothetical protein